MKRGLKGVESPPSESTPSLSGQSGLRYAVSRLRGRVRDAVSWNRFRLRRGTHWQTGGEGGTQGGQGTVGLPRAWPGETRSETPEGEEGVSVGSEAARCKRRHQRQRAAASIQSLYSELRECYPHAFAQEADALHPLEVGIYDQIQDAVGDRYNSRVIRWTLYRHTHRQAYLLAVQSGKPRVNLEGTIVGEVTPAQRQEAEVHLNAKWTFRQLRQATEKPDPTGVGPGGANGSGLQEGADGDSMYEDQIIHCRDCEAAFAFTAGEQQFYASKGFTHEPTRCQPCRPRRKAERSDGQTGFRERPQRQMFPAICDDCGQKTQVPFQPSSDRPVYCRECLARHRSS